MVKVCVLQYDKTLDQMAECPMAKLFRGSNETGLSHQGGTMVERAHTAERRKGYEKGFAIDCFDSKATPDCFDYTVLPPLMVGYTRHMTRTVPRNCTSSTINSQVAVSILSAIMSGPNPVQRTALQVSEVGMKRVRKNERSSHSDTIPFSCIAIASDSSIMWLQAILPRPLR
jgi:hypothetical protein